MLVKGLGFEKFRISGFGKCYTKTSQGPHCKDSHILGCTLGSPIFWKLAYLSSRYPCKRSALGDPGELHPATESDQQGYWEIAVWAPLLFYVCNNTTHRECLHWKAHNLGDRRISPECCVGILAVSLNPNLILDFGHHTLKQP